MIDLHGLSQFLGDEEMEMLPSVRKALEILVRNTEISNLGFYFAKDGRLCGAQTLRIRNTTEILRFASKAILETIILDGASRYWSEISKQNGRDYYLLPREDLAGYLEKLEKFSYDKLEVLEVKQEGLQYKIRISSGGEAFWIGRGNPGQGFHLVHIDRNEGFAEINKYGISARVNLATKAVVPDPNSISVVTKKRLVEMVLNDEPLIGISAEGLFARVPITQEEYTAFNEKEEDGVKFTGVTMSYQNNHLQAFVPRGAKIRMDGIPSYRPNALEYVQVEYGILDKSDVDSRLGAFMGEKQYDRALLEILKIWKLKGVGIFLSTIILGLGIFLPLWGIKNKVFRDARKK